MSQHDKYKVQVVQLQQNTERILIQDRFSIHQSVRA